MRFIVLFCLILVTQCDKDKDPILCTDEFVYGLNITIKDANSSLIITENITITAHDDDYEEELMNFEEEDNFLGAGERPGSYIIEVIADGYEAYTTEVIQVEAGECHVIPEVLEIALQPN
jgi:hypothetical protein